MTLIIRQSRIHSYGCYTTRPIRKGTLIIEYVGEYLTNEQADDLYDDFQNTYLFGLDGGKRIIDGYGVAAFVNHSCQPNCETDQIRGKMWIIALRDIAAGEELTYDYNLYDGEDDAPCLCGSRSAAGEACIRVAPAQDREEAGKGCGCCDVVSMLLASSMRLTETCRIFRCYNHFFPDRIRDIWSLALNRASAGLETIVAKALHRAPASRERVAGLACRVWQRGRRPDSRAEFFRWHSASGSCRCGMAARTREPGAALCGL